MSEIKKYYESKENKSFSKNFDVNKLDYKELFNFFKKAKYYYENKENSFNSLSKPLKKLLLVLAMKPVLIINMSKIGVKFEKYIQEQTGFEQDITSKNFSKDALHKYFIDFLKQNRNTDGSIFDEVFTDDLLKIKVNYKQKTYNLSDIIFNKLYPDIVDYQVVVKGIKKEIDEFGEEIKKKE